MNTDSIEHKEEPSPAHNLAGKRVVVVGGKTGIGLGVAQAAQAAGASVVVASRRSISSEERPDLVSFEQVSLDQRDESSVRAAFETIGPLDHLHVTAGSGAGSWGAFLDEDMHGVRSYMESKFLGSWACARHAVPRLAKDGSITFLTGGTGRVQSSV
jgi:NAD(P)-dependent dehydrogenase (short-subunit alcohol dehydrogenase family)